MQTLQVGDIYAYFNDDLKCYALIQITGMPNEQRKNLMVVLHLDWSGSDLPTQAELENAKPLICDFMYWSNHVCQGNVPVRIPPSYTWVGRRAPLIIKECNSYGALAGLGYYFVCQRHWLEIPQAMRQKFKAAAESTEKVMIADQLVCSNMHSVSDTRIPFSNATELKVLQALSSVECVRWHEGLDELLAGNPFIFNLSLIGHGQSRLDFSSSHLTRLKVEATGLHELILNAQVEELTLLGEVDPQLRVQAKGNGEQLDLEVFQTVVKIQGLENLRSLRCSQIKELDLLPVVHAYPRLKTLGLWGELGMAQNFHAIAQLKNLTELTTNDIFGFIVQDVPAPGVLPHLCQLWFSSLPEDVAKAVKNQYAPLTKEGFDLWIQKGRKPQWIAENLGNPLRHWDGQENIHPAIAKKAATQYKKSRADVLQALTMPQKEQEAEFKRIVLEFTQAFNQMDRRKPFIETIEREDVYTALCDLFDLISNMSETDREMLLDVFDEIRDF